MKTSRHSSHFSLASLLATLVFILGIVLVSFTSGVAIPYFYRNVLRERVLGSVVLTPEGGSETGHGPTEFDSFD